TSGARVLGQGGRYDQLLGLYHPQGKTEPGIGFVLNIEEVHQALLTSGQLPMNIPASTWLVVPETPQAYGVALAYAEKLRTATPGVQVELDLGRRTPDLIQGYARSQGIQQIAWIQSSGASRIEAL
ncbi:MAG: ATP phosphoribosyltransferase regulatory subunit, partial [Microcoleaceae cyanobacterium]